MITSANVIYKSGKPLWEGRLTVFDLENEVFTFVVWQFTDGAMISVSKTRALALVKALSKAIRKAEKQGRSSSPATQE